MTHPNMLFQPAMAAALRNGKKTQTRRIRLRRNLSVGDRIWVRESFRFEEFYDTMNPAAMRSLSLKAVPVWHEADGDGRDPVCKSQNDWRWGRLRASIHMPRFASRTTLVITDIGQERLQDISRDDAVLEGLSTYKMPDGSSVYGVGGPRGTTWGPPYVWPLEEWECDPVRAYSKLWDAINGSGPARWSENPKVWVLKFAVIPENIDEAPEAC